MELGTVTQTTGKRLLRCGEVARLTGLSMKALHHYEEKGLVESVGRTEAGHRLYGEEEEEVARLTSSSGRSFWGSP